MEKCEWLALPQRWMRKTISLEIINGSFLFILPTSWTFCLSLLACVSCSLWGALYLLFPVLFLLLAQCVSPRNSMYLWHGGEKQNIEQQLTLTRSLLGSRPHDWCFMCALDPPNNPRKHVLLLPPLAGKLRLKEFITCPSHMVRQ